MRQWKSKQSKHYILSKAKVKGLFCFLDEKLEQEPCNHTMRFTAEWIRENLDNEKEEDIIKEMNEMGGYCDCEIVLNCYEEYDI